MNVTAEYINIDETLGNKQMKISFFENSKNNLRILG